MPDLNDNTMKDVAMAQAGTSERVPRGTKVLTKAFFKAADNLPDAQRAVVIKAALVAIRDEMKASHGKAIAKKIVRPTAKLSSPVNVGVVKKTMGRPIGSKNKPKAAEAPAVSEGVVVEAAKKTTRKAKQTSSEPMVAD
jgi:hypothetical protein